MKYILVGTNRPGSRSAQVAKIVQDIHRQQGEEYEILDLHKLDLSTCNGSQYSENQPDQIKDWVGKISASEALVVICPEYNGSYPGVLKYFMDHWKFPESYEYRPVCFVGLGGRFGGLRPVEHLQQVFGYRNAFIFPERVFLINCWSIMKDGTITDTLIMELLTQQATNFNKFIKGLVSVGLDALSVQKTKQN
ncbi:MAG: NAD(P)H-dependent oxidoreductase [Bdellovibrionaceae bacterium]|nr:NAD(P)H-dependent oxidoreductase [Bdellovibrionales bacterium]MCB9085075.1 NAD(P)H-dependent oxidoreductase [Pseudobdellovibrionaceae bacterium]